MKTNAYPGMYDKICDLYEPLITDGLEPDGVMYGCRMKFAVEGGRTELSAEFSKKTTPGEVQIYMAMNQARDQGVEALQQSVAKLSGAK